MSVKNTVHFVSEDADLRKSLTSSFKSAGLTLIGFVSASDYLANLGEQKTHACVLVDAAMDGGIELVRDISERRVPLSVVVFVPSGAVGSAMQAVKAGAFDVVERSGESAADVVKKAIQTFSKMQKLLDEKQAASKRVASLTRREGQVLDLMVQGLPNRQIAEELGISPKTLDIHRSNLMDKMEARTVADLCRAHLLNRVDIVHLTHVAGGH